MQLEQFYTVNDDGFEFSREQASRFAKGMANDFNPIHDVDAKRFCVPGDLLFALAVEKLGLSETMSVTFSDMVSDGVTLQLKPDENGRVTLQDGEGRVYLSVESHGHHQNNLQRAHKLATEYVAFSGKTFPHILVPLWKDKGVMVNPARPLVIYESMSISLDTLDFENIALELDNAELQVNGKRGNVTLRFVFKDGDTRIGSGEKRVILSGLKEYDQHAIDELVTFYDDRKKRLAVA